MNEEHTFPCLLEAFFRLFVDKKRHKKDKKVWKKDTLGNDATSKRRLLIVYDAKMKININLLCKNLHKNSFGFPLVKMWFKEREFVSFLMIK